MDNQKLRASILAAVTKEVDDWLAEEKEIYDPIEYEKRMFERILNIGKTMLSKCRGEVSKDRKKRVVTLFGKVDLNTSLLHMSIFL